MDILRIVAFSFTGVFVLSLLRKTGEDIALLLSLVFGVGLFFMVIDKLAAVFLLIEDMLVSAHLNPTYFGAVLRVIGIAYVAEFAANLCRDAKESALGSKVEFAGKVMVLLTTVPIVRTALQAVLTIIGQGW